MKILAEIAYVGSAYHGFQVQDNAPTIQGILTQVCERVFGCKCNVSGCSRTDAGVHALKYFCSFECEKDITIPTERIPAALNCFLPNDIRVKSAQIANDSFHVRYSAKEKEYIYLICDSTPHDPFLHTRVWNYGKKLDEKKMDEAAKALVGRHDFSAFCAAGSTVRGSYERTISRLSVERDGNLIKITARADGFLYNMVRIIAGTLVNAGRSELDYNALAEILNSRDRKRAGMTAPPDGLYLHDVIYS